MPLWRYLMGGGKRACLLAHRRFGKDELALQFACIAALTRVAGYWHMLPEAAQARKAIWNAVNPETGRRRIDECMPLVLRKRTLENEMLIEFKNGSTWQVIGSDRYNSLVGSSPGGVVFSEYATSHPAAWAYIEPILIQNKGYAIFITTVRGKNHAWKMYEALKDDADSFAQILTVDDTPVFSEDDKRKAKISLIAQYGADMGLAFYNQEYMCDINAAILGSYWGTEIRDAERDGRVRPLTIDPTMPVHDAWDIGMFDSTAIWFFQTDGHTIRIVDYHEDHGKYASDYARVVTGKGYKRGITWVPHDAKVREWGGRGTRMESLLRENLNAKLVPDHKLMDGINSVRGIIPLCEFNAIPSVLQGMEALKSYQKEWNEKMSRFSDTPLHNWASHPADAFRSLAIGWREQILTPEKPPDRILSVGSRNQATMRDLDKMNGDNWRRR